MTKVDIDAVLAATLEDRRLSRGERHAIKELILDWNPRPERLAFYRHRAFALAKEAMDGHENIQIVEWLEDVVKAFQELEGKREVRRCVHIHRWWSLRT